MMIYIKILTLAVISYFGVSCDEDKQAYSEKFFYGTWNQEENNPQNFAFYYCQGFEFTENGICYPRYDYEGDGSFITNKDYIGSWAYRISDSAMTFTENGGKFPATYLVTMLSDNEIKLTNSNTGEEYFYNRE